MEAKDLMIGDWVMFNPNVFNDDEYEPYREPHPYQIKTGECVDDAVNGCYEPIPLTAEILEKNRMKVFEHRNPWQEAKNLIKKWYSKDGKFYVSYYRVGNMFTYTVGNGVSRICSIKYVHEFQHALKLCGIEKEIQL